LAIVDILDHVVMSRMIFTTTHGFKNCGVAELDACLAQTLLSLLQDIHVLFPF
jgi:hypothetical protein